MKVLLAILLVAAIYVALSLFLVFRLGLSPEERDRAIRDAHDEIGLRIHAALLRRRGGWREV